MHYFHGMTRTKAITLGIVLLGIISTALVWAESVSSSSEHDTSPQTLTLAFRSTGDQLLHADRNDHSRVLPIRKSSDGWHTISFEDELSIEPDRLVDILNSSMTALNISTDYLAEVIIAGSDSVVYSYLMNGDESASIIPCFGRSLPTGNYIVNVKMDEQAASAPALILGSALLIIVALLYLFRVFQIQKQPGSFKALGNYQLKVDERKLSYKNSDMPLTEKEIELLELLSSRPNQTISRAELQHEIWESKGVVVGRSLDTYVSKLRKKLDKDNSVVIANIHGSGYKLEVRG